MISSCNAQGVDCLVIGGGPAGCTAAALVADSGWKTMLLEREKLPRAHVGESLMPATYDTLDRLGVITRLKRSSLLRKIGVQFVDHRGHSSKPFYFQQHDPQESSTTWHVQRAEFDQLLFKNAAEKGAHCLDGTRVTKLELRSRSPHRAFAQSADGTVCEIEASVVIDATGQQALLAGQLGLKKANPNLRKAAIWGHFEVPPQDCQHGAITTIVHGEEKRVWFWHIPVADNRTSIGLVGDSNHLFSGEDSPQEVFDSQLERCVGLAEFRKTAAQIGALRVAKEFSYTTTQHAGDGWVLIGDAFGFIDPIYSTGVFLALKSGELAADAVVAGLQANNLSGRSLGGWTKDFKAGTKLFRELVDAFYTNEFSFARFLREFPQHERSLTDLLIGRAFQPGAERIFEDLRPAIEAAKRNKVTADSLV